MKKQLPVHEAGTNDLYGVSVRTGFPNPSSDSPLGTPDFNKLLIRHPVATYCMRISGNNWEHTGINDGDIVVIDRAINAGQRDLIIWWQDDSFSIERLNHAPQGTTAWGTVTAIIHQYR